MSNGECETALLKQIIKKHEPDEENMIKDTLYSFVDIATDPLNPKNQRISRCITFSQCH